MPYVTVRWMGGLLTNHKTMNGRVKHLKKLEERMENGELEGRHGKLELQRFQEEIDELNRLFGGIKNMNGAPSAVVVTDVVVDSIAVKEAQRLDIPVVAIVDTNGDPTGIEYPIPANDDAIKSLELILGYMVDAINEGKMNIKAPKEKQQDENSDKKELIKSENESALKVGDNSKTKDSKAATKNEVKSTADTKKPVKKEGK